MDSVLRKQFSGGMDSAKPRLIWISQAEEEGSGEESSACSIRFLLAKFGADITLLHYTIILVYNVIVNAIMWIMKSESAKLGKNLKRIRTEKSITQGDIVRNLGVSRSFISNIENGKTNPTLSTITNIAKALGVSSDELLK